MLKSLKERYLHQEVLEDLSKKMVFVGGPRQVGKTTFAKHLVPHSAYLNWDEASHRECMLKNKLPVSPLIIFDELHKYRSWRNWIKGKFDTKLPEQHFLVTGSARLDLYRRSGDSLQGRYFYYHLHPLSVAELKIDRKDDFLELMQLSGFPEPFFSSSERESRRWQRDYRSRFIREEVNQLEQLQDLAALELMAIRLPELVGSPLSINSLREDLQKNYKTVSHWITILERMYGLFRLAPFGHGHLKSLKKEQKHYHYDWSLPSTMAQKFENLVAGHLLKYIHWQQDREGLNYELKYFRDLEGREVDFVVIKDQVPVLFIEVKISAKEISPHLKYLKKKFPQAQAYQIHLNSKVDYVGDEQIRVMPAWIFLRDFC